MCNIFGRYSDRMVNEERPDEEAVLEEKKAVLRRILSCYMSDHVDEVVAKFFSEAEMAKVVHNMMMYRVIVRRNTDSKARRNEEYKMNPEKGFKSYSQQYYEKNKEKLLEYQREYMKKKKREKEEQEYSKVENKDEEKDDNFPKRKKFRMKKILTCV